MIGLALGFCWMASATAGGVACGRIMRLADQRAGYCDADGLRRQVQGLDVHIHSATAKEARHHG